MRYMPNLPACLPVCSSPFKPSPSKAALPTQPKAFQLATDARAASPRGPPAVREEQLREALAAALEAAASPRALSRRETQLRTELSGALSSPRVQQAVE
jgi:hypothetical protein